METKMQLKSQEYKDTFFSRNFGLREPFCDKDGLYEGCLIPKSQANLLYWMSFWGLITGIIGIYNGYTLLGLGTCIGSFFAQLYWMNPTFSIRRIIDIAWVQVLIWSHVWFSIGTPYFITYATIQIIGAVCYGISWFLSKKGEIWGSTISHAMVHVCANTSLFIMYTS